MKKYWIIMLSCIVATTLMTGTALAKPNNAGKDSGKNSHAPNSNKSASKEKEAKEKKEKEAKEKKEKKEKEAKEKGKGNKEKPTVGEVTYKDKPVTVIDVTYKNQHHKGYKGLLTAMSNVKDKPAGKVLADLLRTQYNIHLSHEFVAELEKIQDKDVALSMVAELLETNVSVTDAVYMEKEAILANIKNMDSYKKLGKYYESLGRKGIKLYVNGEEPSFEVAPFINNGGTLVPFRAITEALNADVKWDSKKRSVTVIRNEITLVLIINSNIAYVNGEQVKLDVPATIVEGSTVVPIRFVSERLNATVKWDAETQSIVIYEE